MHRLTLLGAALALAAFFTLAGATTFVALSAGETSETETSETETSGTPRASEQSRRGAGIEVLEIELDGGPESLEWEVEVIGADGLLREVSVDATSGEILGSETEEPKDEDPNFAPVSVREAETAALEALAVQSVHVANGSEAFENADR